MKLRYLLSFLLVVVFAQQAFAQEVFVAAASNLNYVVGDIIEEFEAETSERVRLSLGSSGNFFTQIQNGAPFDVFLSADVDYPKQLERAGLAEPGSFFVYALGRLVVWTRNHSALDPGESWSQALRTSSGRIAIANPRHAPYGRAATAALEKSGVWEQVADRVVLGENVAQAAQFVHSGAAELGIIPLSLALSSPMQATGRYWELPPDAYPPIEQGAVVLRRARGAGRLPAAEAFAAWMRAEQGRTMLAGWGFSLPPPGGAP